MNQLNSLESLKASLFNMQKVIAVIDDDRQILQALGAWLHMMGGRGSFHSTAEGLLDALVRQTDGLHVRIDVSSRNTYPLAGAIIDLNLPDINGVKLIHKLHQLQPGLPLVLITAMREDESSLYGELPSGVTRVIKPFDLDVLELAIFGHRSEEEVCDLLEDVY